MCTAKMTLLQIAVCGLLFFYVAVGQRKPLPCNLGIRIALPHLFTHCGCDYEEWSEWYNVENSARPSRTCDTKQEFKQMRTRGAKSTDEECTETTETRYVCLPDQEDRLILALGLGGKNNNFKPIRPASLPGPLRPVSILAPRPDFPKGKPGVDGPGYRCPRTYQNGRICHHLTGKRSVSLREELKNDKREPANSAEESAPAEETHEEPAVAFSWTEHGPRLKRQLQACAPGDVQHVLFILDSSGSIGEAQYERMKIALSKLTPLFCKQVQFAMVTFSRNINLEFCFDCFENTYLGRRKASEAIKNATFHDSVTNTAATTKCVCEDILDPSCGINSYPSCLDVVYITDGKSNDVDLDICEEVRCLHHRYGINTYAIGINSQPSFGSSFNQAELNCIADSSNVLSAFQYNSFEDFEQAIATIINRLLEEIIEGSIYACVTREEEIEPTGGVG